VGENVAAGAGTDNAQQQWVVCKDFRLLPFLGSKFKAVDILSGHRACLPRMVQGLAADDRLLRFPRMWSNHALHLKPGPITRCTLFQLPIDSIQDRH
jgi:hypothetical protein